MLTAACRCYTPRVACEMTGEEWHDRPFSGPLPTRNSPPWPLPAPRKAERDSGILHMVHVPFIQTALLHQVLIIGLVAQGIQTKLVPGLQGCQERDGRNQVLSYSGQEDVKSVLLAIVETLWSLEQRPFSGRPVYRNRNHLGWTCKSVNNVLIMLGDKSIPGPSGGQAPDQGEHRATNADRTTAGRSWPLYIENSKYGSRGKQGDLPPMRRIRGIVHGV